MNFTIGKDHNPNAHAPYVVFKNVLTHEECEYIIGYQNAIMMNEGTVHPDDPKNLVWYGQVMDDDRIHQIYEKLGPCVEAANNENWQFDLDGFEEPGFLFHYLTGGKMSMHGDNCDDYFGMHRKLTIHVNLTGGEWYEGGDIRTGTCGWDGWDQRRDQGDVMIFPSYMPKEISEVTEGTQWTYVTFVHGRHFR